MKTKQLTLASAALAMSLVLSVPFVDGQVAVAADGDLQRVQLVIKKLRDSLSGMKELDELEKSGMPKREVDVMRRALQEKINQLQSQALQDIRAL